MRKYPLNVESVGGDTYIVMTRGHHDLKDFMQAAVEQYPGWRLGGPDQVWCKTTPLHGENGVRYNIVNEDTRGAWPATYCWEYGDNWKHWNGLEKEVAHG